MRSPCVQRTCPIWIREVEKLVRVHTNLVLRESLDDVSSMTSSITVGHRPCHRWARWWARRGTGSLSADCCDSNLLNLLRVKTRVCSYNLYATPFFSYPSQFTLVKLIKLKRTQSVCTEKERKRKGKRGKTETERKQSFFHFFSQKNSPQKNIKNKKNSLAPGWQGWGALTPWCQGSHLRLQALPVTASQVSRVPGLEALFCKPGS